MELSWFLAKLIGLYMLIIAAIWLLRKQVFESEVRDAFASKGFFTLTAIIQIVAGLAITISHSIWLFNWQGLITLIGYLALLVGIIRLAFPSESQDFILKSFPKASWAWLAVIIVLGLFLTYHGFATIHDKIGFWG